MKQGLMYYLKIYLKIIGQDIKSKMSYRADFFISIIGILFVNASGFISFWIIFKNFPTIMGWTYEEMLFLYGFSLIALTPMQCFFDNLWSLWGKVLSGEFIKYCFKPLNIYFYFTSETFDVKGLGQLAFGIVALAYSWSKMGLDFSFVILVKLLIGLVSASLFIIALMNIATAFCFSKMYIVDIIYKFKDYARYPVTIFKGVFWVIFTFIIPVGFMAYYPSLGFLDGKNPEFLTYFTPIYGVVFFYLSYKLWMHKARKYSGTGS